MSRTFFDQVDDELRGLLGPKLRTYSCYKASRLIKIWYGEDSSVHYEAQMVSSRWSPTKSPVVEVGLHIEMADAKLSQAELDRLLDGKAPSGKTFPSSTAGRALGPRGASWRRISEVIEMTDDDDPDLASEVAERLRAYITKFGPQ